MDRVADNHYATSELDAIKARDIQSIAADDCVLFLWSTAPMQPQAYEVMAAWSFDYKSQTIWDKGELGTGYCFAINMRCCLSERSAPFPRLRRARNGQASYRQPWPAF